MFFLSILKKDKRQEVGFYQNIVYLRHVLFNNCTYTFTVGVEKLAAVIKLNPL